MADVREIDIDVAGTGKQLGNAQDTLAQNIICIGKSLAQGNIGRGNLQQLIIRDRDKRIAMSGKFGKAGAGIGDALACFK